MDENPVRSVAAWAGALIPRQTPILSNLPLGTAVPAPFLEDLDPASVERAAPLRQAQRALAAQVESLRAQIEEIEEAIADLDGEAYRLGAAARAVERENATRRPNPDYDPERHARVEWGWGQAK